jgi:cyclin-dependent kinase 12/13
MNPQAAVKSKSEKFPPLHEDRAVAFSNHFSQAKQPFTEVKGTSPVQATRVPSISSLSGPQPALSAGLAGNTWGKKHKEEDVRMAPSRAVSRPTKSMTVSDFSTAAYPQQAADVSSISTRVVAGNGSGDNHYREQGGVKAQDSDVGNNGGKVKRRSERHDMHSKIDMPLSQETTHTHDQASSMTFDDHKGVDSDQKDANSLSKLPSTVIPSTPMVWSVTLASFSGQTLVNLASSMIELGKLCFPVLSSNIVMDFRDK